MMLGVLLLVATGFAWTFTGVILSWCSRHRLAPVMLLGPQSLLGVLVVFAVMPDYTRLRAGPTAGEWALVAVMLMAGMVNACGVLTLQRAMHRGHHGVTWAIGQSAMVLPFLVGVLVFGESPSPWRLLGLLAILASLFTLGYVESTPVEANKPAGPAWGLLALAALALLGSGQTLSALPSYMPALIDAAHLRLPVFYLGNGAIMIVLWRRHGGQPDRRIMILAIIGVVTGLSGTLALFHGLDLLAQARLASLGFPIAVGTCIVGFAVYSSAVLREPLTRGHLVGMMLGAAGVTLLAMK